jgi:hypothetical protein
MSGVGTNTGGQTVGWVAAPDGRGTVNLLTSCLLTFGLCVWSAMCLDIPPRRVSQVRLWLLYVKWSMIGALGPELVVYVAWRQLNSARTLQREVQKALAASKDEQAEDEKKASTWKPEGDWSQVHGFYGGMGGYVFDLEKSRPPELASCIPDLHRLTLTARGVALLAKCGLLPEISREEIQDKNKADHLAKTVVCVQAAWFSVQTIGRACQHLPVTLLEINTLAHVVCALLVYLLWWNKPSMVYEPTYLIGDWVPAVCSYMYMSSQISVWERDRPSMSRGVWLHSELSALAYVKNEAHNQRSLLNSSDTTASAVTDAVLSEEGHLRPRATIFGSQASMQEIPAFSKASERVCSPNVSDIRRWQLAVAAIQQYPAIAARLLPAEPSSTTSTEQGMVYSFLTEELVTEYSSNWPSEHLLRGTGGLVMGMILWTASMAFGAIHLSAWHDHFPSVAEAWLWRASALWIASSGGLWMLINLLAKTFPWIDRFWDSVIAFKVNWMAGGLLIVVCGFCGIAYLASRIYLLIEAFISLRALPPRAYETPNWTQVLPHL